jgi:hypothetical protein
MMVGIVGSKDSRDDSADGQRDLEGVDDFSSDRAKAGRGAWQAAVWWPLMAAVCFAIGVGLPASDGTLLSSAGPVGNGASLAMLLMLPGGAWTISRGRDFVAERIVGAFVSSTIISMAVTGAVLVLSLGFERRWLMLGAMIGTFIGGFVSFFAGRGQSGRRVAIGVEFGLGPVSIISCIGVVWILSVATR